MESSTRDQRAVEIPTADDISGEICSYEMCTCYVKSVSRMWGTGGVVHPSLEQQSPRSHSGGESARQVAIKPSCGRSCFYCSMPGRN